MTEADLLRDFRAALDRKDEINASLSSINQIINHIEAQLRDRFESTGLTSFKGDGITVSLREKWRVKYEPEMYPKILAWAVATGNEHCIQRRINDKAVLELLDGGGLPEGLTAEPYKDVSFLRTK